MTTAEQQVSVTENLGEDKTSPKNVYRMDANPFKIRVKIFASSENPQEVYHILRKPTFDEEEARERKMPLIITDAGKVDGADASSMQLDDEPANVGLYDKIATAVVGYPLKAGDKPTEEEISLDRELDLPDGSKKAVRDLIPAPHKNQAINGMFPSEFTVDTGEGDYFFALGGGREWTVKQEIGGKVKQEDGSLSEADYKIYYTLREPTEAERKKFRTSAINAITLRTSSGSKDRRSTNLRVVRDLFDAMVVSVENATINAKEIDVRDKKQLEQIPATFKKGVVIKLFGFLEADLGN